MIKIGTRASRLAVFQAEILKKKLIKAFDFSDEEILIKKITTTGDKIKDKNLYQVGGKGLFIKELEEALLSGVIDIAVHSLKDVPAIIPERLKIASIIDKGSSLDAFLSTKSRSFIDLPENAVLGTSSPRRAAQVLNLRPDIKIVPFRGNVDTRINKLNSNIVDATILSAAGLQRLNFSQDLYSVLDSDFMVPAIGQGVVCAECREGDEKVLSLLSVINDVESYKLSVCERAVLEGLGASCKTPLGGYAWIQGGEMHLKCLVGKYDGSEIIKVHNSGPTSAYETIGKVTLEKLKSAMSTNFFD